MTRAIRLEMSPEWWEARQKKINARHMQISILMADVERACMEEGRKSKPEDFQVVLDFMSKTFGEVPLVVVENASAECPVIVEGHRG